MSDQKNATGGGSQDSIESILSKFEAVARTWTEEDGRPKHLFLDLEQEAVEAKEAILAWHNTQLKAALAKQRTQAKQ